MGASKAVVLLSGGLDSALTLAIAGRENEAVYALTFDYGQRHVQEIACAEVLARRAQVKEHRIMKLDLRGIGGSALTAEIEVPHEQEARAVIPVTYVPGRNTIFLSLALAWAEVLEAGAIYIGANSVDYSGYPDCRPEFLTAFQELANLATRRAVEGAKIKIAAPLINLSKAEIIQQGLSLEVDFAGTHSCYDPLPAGKPCGSCASCRLRKKGFREAGIPDPLYLKKGD